MLSVLLLFGILPASLFFGGDHNGEQASDAEEGDADAESTTSQPSTAPLADLLTPAAAEPDPAADPDDEIPAAPETYPADLAAEPDPHAPASDDDAGEMPPKVDESVPDPAASAEQADALPDEDQLSEDSGKDMAEEGDGEGDRDFMLGPEDGDTTLEGFRPGSDVLDVEIPHSEVTAFRSLDPETGDAQLRLFSGQSEQVITFAGLSQLPVEDIFLLMTDPESGDAISTALAEFMFDESEALDPIAPDEPSVTTPGPDDPESEPLDPIAPETPSAIETAPTPTPLPLPDHQDELADQVQIEAHAAALPLDPIREAS